MTTLPQLARSFPSLSDAPVDPWSLPALDAFAWRACCQRARHAAAFVLGVAAPETQHADVALEAHLCEGLDGAISLADDLVRQLCVEPMRDAFERRRLGLVLTQLRSAREAFRNGDARRALHELAASKLSPDLMPPALEVRLQAVRRQLDWPTMVVPDALGELRTHCPWQVGRFDLTGALRAWDQAHHAAFVAWVLAPWWGPR